MSERKAHTRDMSNAVLTEDSVFPITRKWYRIVSPVRIGVASGDYEIVSGRSMFGDYPLYTVYLNGKRVDSFTSQKAAKIGVEKHSLGFSTCVVFTNYEGWDK